MGKSTEFETEELFFISPTIYELCDLGQVTRLPLISVLLPTKWESVPA